VSSEVGRGTRFHFQLRLEEASPVVSVAPAAALRRLRGRVLVVEDNRVNQRVVTGFLSRLGLEFDVAGDGVAGLEAYAAGRHSLILMDCQMPQLDGLEATRQIRTMETAAASARRVPIVALTANTTAEDRERFRLETLTEILAKWLPEEGK
jgi:CheY-like chemotaxis protein